MRTAFLLRYLPDPELAHHPGRDQQERVVQPVSQVAVLRRRGLIAENDRDEQRKLIKYNHLVANCLIFHNVCS